MNSGKQLSNLPFQIIIAYGYITTAQAIGYAADLKVCPYLLWLRLRFMPRYLRDLLMPFTIAGSLRQGHFFTPHFDSTNVR